jgi:hypothetical protein
MYSYFNKQRSQRSELKAWVDYFSKWRRQVGCGDPATGGGIGTAPPPPPHTALQYYHSLIYLITTLELPTIKRISSHCVS